MRFHGYPLFALLLSLLLVENAQAQPTLFFTDQEGETIQSLDLASGAVNTVLAATLFGPSGLVVDAEKEKMYWISREGMLRRAHLDGTQIEDLFETGGYVHRSFGTGRAMWIDRTRRKVYWNGYDGLFRADLDGSSNEAVLDGPISIWIDEENGELYWTSWVEEAGDVGFFRADLDGSNIDTLNVGRSPGSWDFVVNPDTTVETGAEGEEAKGLVYWANSHEGVYQARLDGTDEKLLVAAGEDNWPQGIVLDPVNKKLYWQAGERSPWVFRLVDARIQRANLDGTEVENVVMTPQSSFGGVAVDDEHVYWISQSLSAIYRVDLDGSNQEDLIVSPISRPEDVALDPNQGKIYWTEPESGRVRRANLDGSEMETLAFSKWDAYGISLDLQNRHLYWSDHFPQMAGGVGRLYRANLDGSDAHEIVDGVFPDIAVDAGNEQVYCSVSEGIIRVSFDGSELEHVLSLLEGSGELTLDQESNLLYWSLKDQIGRMDLASMDTTMFKYGEPGWQRKGLALDSESGDIYWASRVDESEDTARITRIERGRVDGSGYETITVLEGVDIEDMAFVPSGTVIAAEPGLDLPAQHKLHPAYPNPFNASVTLSYSLGEPTHLRLEVLNVLGQVVAILADDFETAGHYTVRWDGRSQAGVPMPSGMYLYRLKTENSFATETIVLAR